MCAWLAVDKETVLVGVVRGSNSPQILKTIVALLAKEHSVLEGKSDRNEVWRHLIIWFVTSKIRSLN
jgi:hypothetical protein